MLVNPRLWTRASRSINRTHQCLIRLRLWVTTQHRGCRDFPVKTMLVVDRAGLIRSDSETAADPTPAAVSIPVAADAAAVTEEGLQLTSRYSD